MPPTSHTLLTMGRATAPSKSTKRGEIYSIQIRGLSFNRISWTRITSWDSTRCQTGPWKSITAPLASFRMASTLKRSSTKMTNNGNSMTTMMSKMKKTSGPRSSRTRIDPRTCLRFPLTICKSSSQFMAFLKRIKVKKRPMTSTIN
jgi:hypothetical protein